MEDIEQVCKRLGENCYTLFKLGNVADRETVITAYIFYSIRITVLINSAHRDIAFKDQKMH